MRWHGNSPRKSVLPRYECPSTDSKYRKERPEGSTACDPNVQYDKDTRYRDRLMS